MRKKHIPISASDTIRARLNKTFRHGDVAWQTLLALAGIVVLLLIVGIGWMLWRDSANAQAKLGWQFFLPTTQFAWDPVNDRFIAWPFIYGTLITSLTAMVIAVPLSLGIGIFLAELCPAWLRLPLGWMLELLAAIPSVVFGLWGIFVFLPQIVVPFGTWLMATMGGLAEAGGLFAGPMPLNGASRLAAGLILAIMITPTTASVVRDVFLAIPRAQREAALALGATQWESIWQVLVPYGLSGILGAVILGLGRALGETMAVTMVIGNSIQGGLSLLQPGYTMSSIIANEFAEAVSELHTEALMEIGLLLFILTLILNMIARLLVWRVAHRMPSAEARG
jgi:phosphate transport system permease protein